MKKITACLGALILSASMVAFAPGPTTGTSAGPVASTAHVLPAACGWRTEYQWHLFQCWSLFGGPVPGYCYKRVFRC